MLLARALRLSPPSGERSALIAFVGAGGKTTGMFQLARELPPPVLVTTTTHLGPWQASLADQHIYAESTGDIERLAPRGVTLVSGPVQGDRLKGVTEDVLLWLRACAKEQGFPLLVEADGARQKPLKSPNEHEPAVPGFADRVIVVAGLSGLGKPLSEEYVHRPQFFSTLSGLPLNAPITADGLGRLLVHPEGGLKNIPAYAVRTVFLNQADTPELQARGGEMSASLLEEFEAVVVGSLQQSHFQTFERTAGIVLAAGGSTRFGQPKQVLDWHGEPFVRAVAQTALRANLSPVIVVVGAYAQEVESALKDLPVVIVHNESWQSGQASSIRVGIAALTPVDPASPRLPAMNGARASLAGVRVGSAIFLLADQPQITPGVIGALVERHTRELDPIVAPLVMMERRANPVLFDRLTFSDLSQLKGDVGGRAIFSKFPVAYLPWHDDRLLLDVDKPEDYDRLKEME